MALSFQDSLALLRMAKQEESAAVPAVAAYGLGDNPVAAYSDDGIAVHDSESYDFDDKYQIFADSYNNPVYTDENYSTINSNREVSVHASQINLTQEQNSQFIPFSMPRYYDGFDLSTGTITIWCDAGGQTTPVPPVNVYYEEDKIYFAWLVNQVITQKAGKVTFEVHVEATVVDKEGNQYGYVWKTKPGSLTVTESKFNVEDFTENELEIREGWIDQLISGVVDSIADKNITEQVNSAKASADLAQQAAKDAQSSKSQVDQELQTFKDVTAPQVVADAKQAAEDITFAVLDEYSTDEELASALGDLEGKTVKEYVDAAVDAVDVSEQLEDYALKTYVDDAVAAVDVSDQLLDYAKLEQLDDYYTKLEANATFATPESVQEAVAAVDVSEQLANYASKDTVYTKEEVDQKLDSVEVDLSGYATETYVDNKVSPLSENITANANSITSLGSTIGELQEKVDAVDTSPRLTYDAVYNDPDDPNSGENKFVLYEIEHEGDEENEVRTPKASFTITGGGGGGGTSSTLKLGYITTSPYIVTINDRAVIRYIFSGTDSSGDEVTEAIATWKIGSKVIATNTAVSGENSFDITDYLSVGTQKVLLSVADDAGSLATKSWSVQQIDVRLESDFNDNAYYPLGDVAFAYKPYGSIDKVIHFKLDGTEIGTVSSKASGIPMSYTLPGQPHGAHLVEAYITANLNNNEIESNHIFKDVIWYDESVGTPVIGCAQQSFTAKQYDSTSIVYNVYDPSTETPTVELAVDGKVVSTLKLEAPKNTWAYKSSDVGEHTLTITCGETVKTINVTIEKLDIDVAPVTAGLKFDFNPTGKSNNDADRLWSDGNVTMTVSDNFDWTNGGYQIDENGDQYFCVKSGTTATINYNLFSDDPKRNGKEFKFIFKTTNVKNRATSFLTCLNNNIGLDMKVESANVYSSNDSLYSPYCEDDIIEFEFNINKDTDIPMVLTYEDGVANRPMIYTSDSSFMQPEPQPITIGCADCDVHVYRMKAYSNSLSDSDILSNFIADARNAEEMISRYNRNQIYDENGALTPEVLAEKCPDLRVIIVDCPRFTTDKSDKVSGTNITMIYKNGDPVLDNWTCTGAQHSGQGTSSNEYGYAGRNLDLIMNTDDALFTFGDGETTGKTFTFTRDSIPVAYANIKVNIASSENQNNAQMTMRYNQYNPYIRPARLVDSKKRDTMAFYDCVVFVREYNEDLSTHNEFSDTSTHYYALGNIGDSKKTDASRMFDSSDPKEHTIEIMDYNVALAEFPTGYTDAEGNKAICPESEWKEGNPAYDYLYADYKYKDGKFKSFGSESYEFRYEKKNITDEERQANIDAWREAYRFVVTSDDETFKSDFKKYFVQDSVLFYYLFVERYTLVDNLAKNCFPHYAKAYYTQAEAEQFKADYGVDIQSEYIDDELGTFNGGYRYDWTQGYDFDKQQMSK